MSKKSNSTFDEFMNDKVQKELFEKEFKDLLISEMLLALMENDEISVRRLAEGAGISATTVQNIRSGKQKNVSLRTFVKLIDTMGYEISIAPRSNK